MWQCCCPDRHVPEGIKTKPKTNPKKPEHNDGKKKHPSSDKKEKPKEHPDGKKGKGHSPHGDLTLKEVQKLVSQLGGVKTVLSKGIDDLNKQLASVGAAVGASALLAAIKAYGPELLAVALNPF